MIYHLYTDGACQPNPGIGGWAYLLICKKNDLMLIGQGSVPQSTNNQMELTPIIKGMEIFTDLAVAGDVLHLHSDSTYLLNGTETWVDGWVARNWIKKDKKPVKNRDLWEQIYKLKQNIYLNDWSMQYEHIKGHSGHPENELVDKLAVGKISHAKLGIIDNE